MHSMVTAADKHGSTCGSRCGWPRRQGNSRQAVGALAGHGAAVTHIVTAGCQVVSLAADHVIKVWVRAPVLLLKCAVSGCGHAGHPLRAQDLRSSRCMQTIDEADWRAPEDARPTALMYDAACHRLITASRRPLAWAKASESNALPTHAEPLVTALYNTLFNVVRI